MIVEIPSGITLPPFLHGIAPRISMNAINDKYLDADHQ
jgi:hypothetical protein